MDTNKMRAEFEVFWAKQFWAECYEDVKEQMFGVWRASREAAELEIPDRYGISALGELVPSATGPFVYVTGLCESIGAAGLKVAP